MSETQVLCRGNDFASMEEAYFPIQRLEDLVQQYIEPDAFFPFLWLDEEATYDAIPPDWKDMLTAYGIGSAKDLDFALEMLHCSLNVFSDGVKPFSHSSKIRLFGLYQHIQARYREAGAQKPTERDKLR